MSRCFMVPAFRWGLAFLLGLCLACSRSKPALPPPLYEVKGLVVVNGKPLNGGTIQFSSISGPPLTTQAEIQPDGRFELFTLFEGKRLPGAVEGDHQVTVFPALNGGRGSQPISLPKPTRVEARSMDIRLELPAR